MVDTKYSELIAQYLSKDITVRDKEKLMAWVDDNPTNKAYFDEMQEVWDVSDVYEEDFVVDTNVAWDKLDKILSVEEGPKLMPEKDQAKIVPFRKKWWSMAAAIALLISVGGYLWFNQEGDIAGNTKVVATGADELNEIVLPDGSKVWLNEDSKLTYHPDFVERNVELEGEAFFDIVKKEGATFKIFSGEATTTVLGTSFNVRAYPDEDRIEVTVETGVVKLEESDRPSNKVELPAGKSGYYDNKTNQAKVNESKNVNAQSWRTKTLDLGNANMKEVALDLERYFDVEIKVENPEILKCNWTNTNALKNPKLEDIFEALNFATGLEIEFKDSIYYIKGVGCN